MLDTQDVERGEQYPDDAETLEREALLPTPRVEETSKHIQNPYIHCTPSSKPRFGFLHLIVAFCAGGLACLTAQYATCGSGCVFSQSNDGVTTNKGEAAVLAPPYVGSTERHNFPPMTPTNAYPSMFPTGVGYAGETPTGAEPALIATAPSYPLHTGAAQLIVPSFGKPTVKGKGFDLFKKWGNLSPWYSVDRTAFGLDTTPEPPRGCRVTGLHLLHRHGARYPTSWCES